MTMDRRAPRHLRVAAIAGAFGLLLAACGDNGDDEADGDDGEATGGESMTLSYAFFAPEASFPAVQMQEWADRMAEETDGQVDVDLFPGGTLLEAGNIYDGVASGVADVGIDAPVYDVGRFPVLSVMSLPLDFPNARVASHTMLDLLEEYEPDELDGFQIVTAFTSEPAYLQTTLPVEGRDDLAGVELRTTGAGVSFMEALGASPVAMPMSDVPEAMQTGVVEGYLTSREVLEDFGLAEQVSHMTDYAFGLAGTFVAVMEQDAFDALPEDIQQAIHDLRPEMTGFASTYHDEENVASSLEFAEDEDVETIELDADETAAWDEALEPIVDDWVQTATDNGLPAQEILDRTLELRDQYIEEFGE